MGFLTDIATWIAPGAAVKRAQARAAIQMLEERTRRHKAAGKSSRTKDWKATQASANAVIRAELPMLRARSRDMFENNGYLRQAVRRLTANVIGSGFRPSVNDVSRNIEKKLLKSWRLWADSMECDWEERMSFYALQSLIMQTVVLSGEAIIRRRRDNTPGVPLQLQVQEGDVIDTSKDGYTMVDGSYVKLGIEFDARGKRTAYWLFDEHPGDGDRRGNLTSRRIPASEIIHVYHVLRPGQLRGLPWTVAMMLKMRDLDQYEDAQIIRQKIAACFTAFVQDQQPDASLSAANDLEYDRLEPGRIEELPAGKTIHFSSPPPAEGYHPFVSGVLRAGAAGIGLSYEAMTGDFSQVNFSSGRMGWIEMSREIAAWQAGIIEPMCVRIWRWWIEASVLAGQTPTLYEKKTAAWTPPRREMLDPVKEAKGITEMLQAGLISWSEAARKQGYDPQDVMEELADDLKAFDEAGVVPGWDGRLQKIKAQGAGNAPATE